MYQVFVSKDGSLEPGARFRLLGDALSHVERNGRARSFAIKQPDGSWYRDPQGRSIMGQSARTRRATTKQGSGEIRETTRAQGSGPSLARGSGRFQVRFATEDPHETTAVDWPPVACAPSDDNHDDVVNDDRVRTR